MSSRATELIEIAGILKNKLKVYKDEVSDYSDNAEMMEMIFSLGMDSENVYLSSTSAYLGEKKFDESLASEIVDFIDKAIEEFNGWIPLAEVYCRFNRKRGTGIIPPLKLVQICETKLDEVSMGKYIFLKNFEVSETESIKMICKSELSVENVVESIIESVYEDEGMTPEEISQEVDLNVKVLQPFLGVALRQGDIVIDKQHEFGVQYYKNTILEMEMS